MAHAESCVKKILRHDIKTQVVAFRSAQFPTPHTKITCPLSGEKVLQCNVHVHHAGDWTFNAIVQAFMHEQRLSFDQVNQRIEESSDPVRRRFQFFHEAMATLQMVSSNVHLNTKHMQMDGAALYEQELATLLQ